MPDYIDPVRRMRAKRQARLGQPDQTQPAMLDWMGGDVDIADRAAHRSGLRDAPLSELPGALARAGGIATGVGVLGLLGMPAGMISRDMDVRSAQEAVASMNTAGGVANPELAGRSDPSQIGGGYGGISAADLAAATAEAEANVETGVGASPYYKGGVVRPNPFSIDPPGPDDQLAAVKTGERVLTETQFKRLSKSARAEVEKLFKERAGRRRA